MVTSDRSLSALFKCISTQLANNIIARDFVWKKINSVYHFQQSSIICNNKCDPIDVRTTKTTIYCTKRPNEKYKNPNGTFMRMSLNYHFWCFIINYKCGGTIKLNDASSEIENQVRSTQRHCTINASFVKFSALLWTIVTYIENVSRQRWRVEHNFIIRCKRALKRAAKNVSTIDSDVFRTLVNSTIYELPFASKWAERLIDPVS